MAITRTATAGLIPQVTMDNNGNAIIVWSQHNPAVGRHEVFISEYRNGSWIHPADLTSASYISLDGTDASNPQVSMDDNAIIVWQQFDGANRQIFKSEYRP